MDIYAVCNSTKKGKKEISSHKQQRYSFLIFSAQVYASKGL